MKKEKMKLGCIFAIFIIVLMPSITAVNTKIESNSQPPKPNLDLPDNWITGTTNDGYHFTASFYLNNNGEAGSYFNWRITGSGIDLLNSDDFDGEHPKLNINSPDSGNNLRKEDPPVRFDVSIDFDADDPRGYYVYYIDFETNNDYDNYDGQTDNVIFEFHKRKAKPKIVDLPFLTRILQLFPYFQNLHIFI